MVVTQRAPQENFCNITRVSAPVSIAARCTFATVCSIRYQNANALASRRVIALHRAALEDADEYRALVAALAAEHAPQGPTEEHLVEELAGILWRKRRLRLAEAAAHRRGLDGTLASGR